MVQRLKKSNFGEGVGGPVSTTDDPDNPSFDMATHKTSTEAKISALLADDVIPTLNKWEIAFLTDVYGMVPLSRRQHIKVSCIYKEHIGIVDPPP